MKQVKLFITLIVSKLAFKYELNRAFLTLQHRQPLSMKSLSTCTPVVYGVKSRKNIMINHMWAKGGGILGTINSVSYFQTAVT